MGRRRGCGTPWDHPRSRGVYVGHGPRPGGRPRIIPARAGFTGRPPRPRSFGRDHPRSRGVYWTPPPAWPTSQGSSPLARGLLDHAPTGTVRARIIPARAGFTALCGVPDGGSADHPRSRGVYRPGPIHPRGAGGSSPLARGLHVGPQADEEEPGIIPARAGFTPTRGRRRRRRTDHPRSRGVYGYQPGSLGMSHGSSPLARGLHRAGRRL